VSLSPVEASTTVTVVPSIVSTKLTITAPSVVVAGVPFTVSGRLTADGVGVGGATIEIYVGANLVTRTTTGPDGGYSASITIPAPGTYTIKARFPGATIPPIRVLDIMAGKSITLAYTGFHYPEQVVLKPAEATITIGGVEAAGVPWHLLALAIIVLGAPVAVRLARRRIV
jgi:hypothetical protein